MDNRDFSSYLWHIAVSNLCRQALGEAPSEHVNRLEMPEAVGSDGALAQALASPRNIGETVSPERESNAQRGNPSSHHTSPVSPPDRHWVHEPPTPRYVGNPHILTSECWRLKDKCRDWAVIHRLHSELMSYDEWIAVTLPGNGKHEYTGTFNTADAAKAAVERRLAR